MNRIDYMLESSKVDTDKNIAICSDLHINRNTPKEKLDDVLETLSDIQPTHIVIPGDLYDVDDTTISTDLRQDKVSLFIDNASEIADVFYVKGNAEQKSNLLPYGLYNNHNEKFHLLCERNTDGKYKYVYNNGINVLGIKLPLDFYKLSECQRTKYLLVQYKKYLEKLSKHCGNKNFNVLLCHDPIIVDAMRYLKSSNEVNANFDLIISGHNHGGIWPDYMKPFFKLIGANMELYYPSYTKGIVDIDKENGKMIVSEGITKFNLDFGKLQLLNRYNEGTIENVKILSKKSK